MRFLQAPRPLLHLITTILLTSPRLSLANPNPHPSEQAGFSFNELFARYECGGSLCGYYNQLCCTAGSACATDANDIATCTANSAATVTAAAGGSGYWQYYTTTYVETDLVTVTSVMSSYVAGAAATATASCNWALNESPCGNICCASNQYCFTSGQCSAAAGGGSSGYYSTYTPGASAPIRPTTSGTVVIVASVTPTTTVPFATPVATGANVTIVGSESDSSGSGLSGGAIAGIVIGVLAGLALLGLLCFYCCLKGLLDGCLACFGLGGRRRRRTTEVEEYERYSHHSGRGGGRTWYGAARPATRVDRTEKKSHEGRNLLGIGAGLAALWAILGLKRRREQRRREDKYSDFSSDYYYTSASSASSDDRRTRETRYSRR